MNIPIKMQMLIDDVLRLNHSAEEWLELEKDAERILAEANDDQQDYFAESGAGEALYMACSGLRINDHVERPTVA